MKTGRTCSYAKRTTGRTGEIWNNGERVRGRRETDDNRRSERELFAEEKGRLGTRIRRAEKHFSERQTHNRPKAFNPRRNGSKLGLRPTHLSLGGVLSADELANQMSFPGVERSELFLC